MRGSHNADGNENTNAAYGADKRFTAYRPSTASSAGFEMQSTGYRRDSQRLADAVAMLDGTPVPAPSSVSNGSRSPRFREHMSELEDTSSYTAPPTPPLPAHKRLSRLSTAMDRDSPTLGGQPADPPGQNLSASAPKPRDHMMSWNNYDEKHTFQTSGANDAGEAVGATMMTAAKSLPKALSPGSDKHQVSPDLSSTPLDRSFVVSPFGSVDMGRAKGMNEGPGLGHG